MPFESCRGLVRPLAKLFIERPALKRKHVLDRAKPLGQARREPFRALANAVGHRPALPAHRVLEHLEPAGERLIDPVAMGRNRTDCFICSLGEACAYIIGLVTNRGYRMLGGRIKILAQQARILSKGSNGAACGGSKMLAHLACLLVNRP